MESLLEFISSYVSYWPITVCLLLLLAGFNLPVSEDAVIILSAAMVHQDTSIMIPTYIALYIGIFGSDLISFSLGRLLSAGFLNFKFLTKKLTPKRIEWITKNLEEHGLMTYITCRFIPFGVRNVLFIGSGFVKLPYVKFIFFDSIAALISSSTLFFLVYFIGQAAKKGLEVLGVVLFAALIIAIIVFLIVRKKRKNAAKNSNSTDKSQTSQSAESDL